MNDTLLNLTAADGFNQLDAIDELPVAYLEMNAQGVVTRANRAAHAIYLEREGDVVGKDVWELVAADQKVLGRAAFLAIMESGEEPPVIRRSLYNGNGEFRTYELHRSLIRNEQGRPAGMRIATIDVTEAQIAHEEAHRARMWLQSVLESVADAVIVTDALGFVRYINLAAVELSGWEVAELTGMVIEKGLPVLSYVSYDKSDKTPLNFRMALSKRSKGIATLLDRHRQPLQVEISASPILDRDNGYTIGVVSVLRKVESAV